jgi:hypothetical protein
MDDFRTRAQLVAFDSAGAVGTVVTRAEVAEAAAGPDFPATLQLELDRVDAGEGDTTAHASLAVDWDRDTLEQLLASTPEDEIALWFDERELAQAFDDAEVEGHGLRQRAAVIAVAVTAAGASATPALARMAPANEGGGGGTPAAAAVAQPAGAERGLQQDESVSATQGTHGFSVDPAAARRGAVVQPAGAERGLLQDEQVAVSHDRGTGTTVASSGDATLSTGELAAVVAGGALLIAAAGFGATRRRMPPAQPA